MKYDEKNKMKKSAEKIRFLKTRLKTRKKTAGPNTPIPQIPVSPRLRTFRPAALCAVLLLTAAVLFSLCACSTKAPSDSSADPIAQEKDTYQAASLTDFKEAASVYGTVTDMTEQLTYESAAVKGNDRYNIIYMKAVTPEQAEDILFSDSGPDTDPTVNKLRSGDNYCYYEENAAADPASSTAAFYGRYLRIDNVLLIVTGAPEDKTGVQETSEKLFSALGYEPD